MACSPEKEVARASDEPSGWATIAKLTQDMDERQVEKYKEDVDTLLVFTGLFSAVVTAFVVQSYQSLLQDPQVTVVDLLTQITLQSKGYTITKGFLNATAQPSIPPQSFQPGQTDILVNLCWFASLILSLATASFAMLVKQWFNEYLSMPYTAPQERLRIRHMRHQGLHTWRVFEIANALPVLLQFSLALFFAGLCVFVKEVHATIAITSLSLVGIWAVIWSFAAVAPLLWIRCPYSTSSLQPFLRRRRPHIAASIKKLFHRAFHLIYKLSKFVPAPNRAISRKALEPVPSSPAQLSALEKADVGRILVRILDRHTPERTQISLDESILRHTSDNDLSILDEIDSILLDDGLLVIMRPALQTGAPTGIRVLKLVISAMRRRLDVARDDGNLAITLSPHLESLSNFARLSLICILADALLSELDTTTVDQWHIQAGGREWMDEILLLIVALLPPRMALPDSAYSVLRQILQPSPKGQFNGCDLFASRVVATAVGQKTTDTWQATAFTSISGVLRALPPQTFTCIVHWSYLDLITVSYQSNTFHKLLDTVECGEPVVQHNTLRVLVDVAAATLHSTIFPDGVWASDHQTRDLPLDAKPLLDFIVRAIPLLENVRSIDYTQPQISGGIGLDKLFMDIVSTPALIFPFMESISRYPDLLSKDRCVAQDLVFGPLSRLHLTHNFPVTRQLEILNAFADYFDATWRSEHTLNTITVLRLCLLVTVFPLNRDTAITISCQRTFTAIANCLGKADRSTLGKLGATIGGTPGWSYSDEAVQDSRDVAHIILHLMDGDDQDGMQRFRVGRPTTIHGGYLTVDEDCRYSRWAAQFDVGTSLCPNEIVASLARISNSVVDKLGRRFWRVRLLKDLKG